MKKQIDQTATYILFIAKCSNSFEEAFGSFWFLNEVYMSNFIL